MEKISLKDSPMQEDKPKDEEHGEVQDVEVESTQPLSKNWRYATNHPKDLITGDVSKGVTTRSKLRDIYDNFVFISHIGPKTSSKSRAAHIGCLHYKKSSINLSAIKFDNLFLDPMIDQSLVLNRFLGIRWMSQKMI